MPRLHFVLKSTPTALLAAILLPAAAFAQPAVTWEQVRERFEAANLTLSAARLGVDENRAQEITAHLRPNPVLTSTADQINPFTGNPYRPFSETLPFVSTSYLYERQHKRSLRYQSAKQATEVAISQVADQRRTLLFSLRNSFVQLLQAKAVLNLAHDNLTYYDRLLDVSRVRFKAGDIARVDLDRLELQRVPFEADLASAEAGVRTAKIQLLALMNEKTPIDRFDISGIFEFAEPLVTLDELHRVALEARPDLRAAQQSIDRARTEYRLAVANGSADPIFALNLARNPPIPAYMGVSVTVPLRIHDRNQGEKARTLVDISRTQRLREAAEVQVFSDVDSAWTSLNSNLPLLRNYKSRYLDQAARVRDTISFSYQHGGASLLDFLNAQSDYRTVQLNYLNLVGAYMTSAGHVNEAVGREVIP